MSLAPVFVTLTKHYCLHEWGKVRSQLLNWRAQSFFHARWGVCSPLCLGITSHQKSLATLYKLIQVSIMLPYLETFYHSGMKRYAESLLELSKKGMYL